MSHSLASLFLQSILRCTVLISVAIVLVGILRKPLRHAVGAQAAYLLWLALPLCALATWLPASRLPQTAVVRSIASWSGSPTPGLGQTTATVTGDHAGWWLGLWATGCALAATYVIWPQRRFIRSLGDLRPDQDGVCYSETAAGPMLVGVWRPRLVMPSDAEARYTHDERRLILAHERAHMERRDTLVNAFALGTLCLSWFNPLMHWAVRKLRQD